ncbi:MAG: class I SAM-dependent methyltransferase [Candidatus Caldarchaeum sp.]|nr:class I SAM-dependent methyltransferase [Candidatus Caldarchaeum sp.]
MAILDYDVLAEGYDELYGDEQRSKYRAVFDRVRVDGCLWVLDVGCGTGLFLSFLRERGVMCEYVGVDVSTGMLDKALARLDCCSHLVSADAHRLPFRDKAFTHLYCFTTVHHLDIQRFVEEAGRVCSGVLVVSQHKRLSPRLEVGCCGPPTCVDEFVVIDYSKVLRQASAGSSPDSLSGGGQAP